MNTFWDKLGGVVMLVILMTLLWFVAYGLVYRAILNPLYEPETVTIVGVTHDSKVILLFHDNNVKEFDSGKLMTYYLAGDTQIVVEVNRRYVNQNIVDEVR